MRMVAPVLLCVLIILPNHIALPYILSCMFDEFLWCVEYPEEKARRLFFLHIVKVLYLAGTYRLMEHLAEFLESLPIGCIAQSSIPAYPVCRSDPESVGDNAGSSQFTSHY